MARFTIVAGPFYPVPPSRGGAVERSIHEIATELARRGHDVCVMSRLCDDLKVNEVEGGVRHIRCRGADQPRKIGLALLYDIAYAWRVANAIPWSDITITNSLTAPVVLSKVERAGKVWPSIGRVPKGQCRLYRGVAGIITNTKAIASKIEKEAPHLKDRIVVIPQPIPKPAEERFSRVSFKKKECILYVGRINQEKGVHHLVEAWRRACEELDRVVPLNLVGPIEERLGGSGWAYARRLVELSSRWRWAVHLHGPEFDYEKLLNWYEEALIFVYPSVAERGETLGVAVIEAMAAGCCTIVSDLAVFREYLEPEKSGLVFNHRNIDAESELARTLIRVLADQALRERLAGNARKAVERFTLGKIADAYERLAGERKELALIG